MKRIIKKVDSKARTFRYCGVDFSIEDKPKKIWTLHKRFGRSVAYRVLNDLSFQVPIAIQRRRYYRKAS